ncbi:MAG: hypothetical protein WKG03_01270 [Telluria sp.]
MKKVVYAFACSLLVMSTSACPREAAASSSYTCPITYPVPKAALAATSTQLDAEMQKRFDAVIGADAGKLHLPKVAARVSRKQVDKALMTSLAQVAGCGALIDRESSCSIYFDPGVGDPLSTIMDMKKSAPLRMQFEAAIKNLPNRQQREAAQHCIKLVGK